MTRSKSPAIVPASKIDQIGSEVNERPRETLSWRPLASLTSSFLAVAG